MITEDERQAIVDADHLALLPIGYWVTAGFWALYGLGMAAYFGFFGLMFLTIPAQEGSGPPPRGFALVFLGMALFFVAVLAASVTLKFLAASWLRKRTHRIGTMIAAALSCLEVPYGTLLGVLTFIVLVRPSVKQLYEAQAAADARAVEAGVPRDSVAEPALPADGADG